MALTSTAVSPASGGGVPVGGQAGLFAKTKLDLFRKRIRSVSKNSCARFTGHFLVWKNEDRSSVKQSLYGREV
jgi:hypothetical protein